MRCRATLTRRLFLVTGYIQGYGPVERKTQAWREDQAILQTRKHFRKKLGWPALWIDGAEARAV